MRVDKLFDSPLRGVPRPRRKSIMRAIQTPTVLSDPDDAEFLVRVARWQRRIFHRSRSPAARVIRAIGAVWLLTHAVRLAMDEDGLAAIGFGTLAALLLIGFEVAGPLVGRRLDARTREAERINAAYLEGLGRSLPEEVNAHRVPDRTALLSVAALPASFVWLALGAWVEGSDEPIPHDRLVAATAIAAGLGGLTCAVGLVLGLRAWNRAGSRKWALAGVRFSTLGLLVYAVLAVIVPLTEW